MSLKRFTKNTFLLSTLISPASAEEPIVHPDDRTSKTEELLPKEVAETRLSLEAVITCTLDSPDNHFIDISDKGTCPDGSPLKRDVLIRDGDWFLNVVLLRHGDKCDRRRVEIRRLNPVYPFENLYFLDEDGDGDPEKYFRGSVAPGAPFVSRNVKGRKLEDDEARDLFWAYTDLLKEIETKCK